MKSFQKAEHRTASFFNTRSHTEDWLTQFLNRLPEGLTEIGIHPGTVEAWRRIEFAALAHDSVKPFLVANNISNISYKDI